MKRPFAKGLETKPEVRFFIWIVRFGENFFVWKNLVFSPRDEEKALSIPQIFAELSDLNIAVHICKQIEVFVMRLHHTNYFQLKDWN